MASLPSGTAAITWSNVGRVQQKCSPEKTSAGREIVYPEPIQQCCLPTYFKENVTQVTINQTDSPNFNRQLLQLETSLNDYNANLFLDRKIKLVVLISIIIAIWQTGKSLHRIRIMTTQPGALQRQSGDNLTLNKLLTATAQLH